MPPDNRQILAFALLGLAILFWAGNSIVGRAVRDDIPPFTLSLVRWAGAFLVVLPFAIQPLKRDLPELQRSWKIILLLGLLGVAAFNSLLYNGLRFTTATNALLLQAGVPALVVILNRMIFGVRAGALQVLATCASVMGVVLIVFEGDLTAVLGLHLGVGDALVLAAVLAWSLYTVLLRLSPVVSATSFIAATFAIGIVTMTPLALYEWLAGKQVVWSWAVVGAFAYVALLPSLASYFIYNSAVRNVGPARAGQAITLMPVFGAFLSALLLGEPLFLYHGAGIALISAGIVFGALALRNEERAKKLGGAVV